MGRLFYSYEITPFFFFRRKRCLERKLKGAKCLTSKMERIFFFAYSIKTEKDLRICASYTSMNNSFSRCRLDKFVNSFLHQLHGN